MTNSLHHLALTPEENRSVVAKRKIRFLRVPSGWRNDYLYPMFAMTQKYDFEVRMAMTPDLYAYERADEETKSAIIDEANPRLWKEFPDLNPANRTLTEKQVTNYVKVSASLRNCIFLKLYLCSASAALPQQIFVLQTPQLSETRSNRCETSGRRGGNHEANSPSCSF